MTEPTPEQHYARGLELLAVAERARSANQHDESRTDATLAHGYFTAATAAAALNLAQAATHAPHDDRHSGTETPCATEETPR